MCQEGGHHYLSLGREVEIARSGARARARDHKRVFARSARDERCGREEAEGLLENSMYWYIPVISVSVSKERGGYCENARYSIFLRSA
jgi:hypothetical protein